MKRPWEFLRGRRQTAESRVTICCGLSHTLTERGRKPDVTTLCVCVCVRIRTRLFFFLFFFFLYLMKFMGLTSKELKLPPRLHQSKHQGVHREKYQIPGTEPSTHGLHWGTVTLASASIIGLNSNLVSVLNEPQSMSIELIKLWQETVSLSLLLLFFFFLWSLAPFLLLIFMSWFY